MKTLLIVIALTACEHEEDAELEESLDACEQELCDSEEADVRAVCIGIRFDRRALDHESIVPDEGKMRRVPISMTIVYKEQLFEYYCRGEVKDRVERFDGVIHEDSELPAPKDAKNTNDPKDTENTKDLKVNTGSSTDRAIACQEEVLKRAKGATSEPPFKHPSGFNCVCANNPSTKKWHCLAR